MFWFKKYWCCSVPSDDEDEEPHRPKPEKKEKKKKWWQRRKKKERQEEMNVEENQMIGNEETARMSTQVLQDQGQEPEVQVIQMEEKNQAEQSMKEKNMEEMNPEEQNLVIEGIEDPLQAVVLEKIFRSSDEVVQQQNVQDEHVLIAPTFIIKPEDSKRLMETTVKNQGVSMPAGAPVPPVYMLKMKRTSRWTVRPVLVLPSSKYVSSALLCSAALWRPSERPRSTGIVPPDHLEKNLQTTR
ncbi:uncharacterized protein LOC134311424 isoform X2 [Trichomycterus rosablanca]|uniref:uncharacterized protein LOC134311424 isoform X2 n=1 Tax=Trichomycterus rosablanca TaxID=2290929 RepID=UPI002F35BF65